MKRKVDGHMASGWDTIEGNLLYHKLIGKLTALWLMSPCNYTIIQCVLFEIRTQLQWQSRGVGRCLAWGGVSALGGVLGGVCPEGGVWPRGSIYPRVCLPREGGVTTKGGVHPLTQRQTYRITDKCKNITFPQLLLRTVKMSIFKSVSKSDRPFGLI